MATKFDCLVGKSLVLQTKAFRFLHEIESIEKMEQSGKYCIVSKDLDPVFFKEDEMWILLSGNVVGNFVII